MPPFFILIVLCIVPLSMRFGFVFPINRESTTSSLCRYNPYCSSIIVYRFESTLYLDIIAYSYNFDGLPVRKSFKFGL